MCTYGAAISAAHDQQPVLLNDSAECSERGRQPSLYCPSRTRTGQHWSRSYALSIPADDDQRPLTAPCLHHCVIGQCLCRFEKPNSSKTSLFTHGEHHLMEAERPLSCWTDSIQYMLPLIVVFAERQQSEIQSIFCYRNIPVFNHPCLTS